MSKKSKLYLEKLQDVNFSDEFAVLDWFCQCESINIFFSDEDLDELIKIFEINGFYYEGVDSNREKNMKYNRLVKYALAHIDMYNQLPKDFLKLVQNYYAVDLKKIMPFF